MYVISVISRKTDAPEFLAYPLFTSREEVFAPARPDRRGEAVAWLCALGVTFAIAAAFVQGRSISSLSLYLLVFFTLAGGLISLGNWMEANTRVLVSRAGLTYANPLRTNEICWQEVERLAATSIRGGWRMRLEAEEAAFNFSTSIKIRLGSRTAVIGGYPDADRLAALIRGMAGLSEPRGEGRTWVSTRD